MTLSTCRDAAGTLARVIALALVLVGFAIRIWNLDTQSFWWDEAYSAVVARGTPGEIMRTIASTDFHPPLHYVVLHLWRLVAGESEFALRLVSAFAGTAVIALSYATARRLFGTQAGVVTGFLFVVAPYLVYYSTEARMFAIATFLALLVLYTGLRAIDEPEWWPLVGLALAGSLYNFYYGVFPAIAIGLLALAQARRRPGALIGFGGASALALLLYAPWLPIQFSRVAVWSSPWTSPTSPWRVLAWTWPTLMTGIPTLDTWRQPVLAASMLGVVALTTILIVWAIVRRDRRYGWALLFAAVAVIAPLAVIAAIATIRPIYHPRYAMAAAPAVFLLLGGTLALPSWRALPLRLALAACLAIPTAYGFERVVEGAPARDDYRSAITLINDREAPGDVAIYNAPPGFQYYYRGSMPHEEFPPQPYGEESIVRALNRVARDRDRLWYITHALVPTDPEGFVEAHLRDQGRLLLDREFGHIRVALFDLPPSPSFATLPVRELSPIVVGDYLTIVGVGLGAGDHRSGEPLSVTLTWEVQATPPSDLGVWVRLLDSDGFVWGRVDRQPRDSAYRLPSGWPAGERVTSHHAVPVLVGTPPGTYRLEVGIYRQSDTVALEMRDRRGEKIGPSATVGQVEIGPGTADQSDQAPSSAELTIDSAVSLIESRLASDVVAAGASLELSLLWRVEAPPGARDLIVRLLDEAGTVVAERTMPPTRGVYPPERWSSGEIILDQQRLPIPASLAPGRYGVWAGLGRPDGTPQGTIIGDLAVTAVPRDLTKPEIARELEVDFGDGMRLAGWDASIVAGSPRRLNLTLYWHPDATPSAEYRIFNHVLDPAGKIVAQRDGVPVEWTRPTTGWIAGEWIADTYSIELPDGDIHSLRIGVYDPVSGQRRSTATGEDHLDLGRLPPG